MIGTMAQLLEELRRRENEALKRENVDHPGTIGDMYEGLTQDLLSRASEFAQGIDVTTGFIVDDSGNQSDQLDCMVVRGAGEVIPYTQKKRYRVDDVVAVVEVKKNLYAKDLKGGYENLASVQRFEPDDPKSGRLLRHAFEGTTLRPLPMTQDDWDGLTHGEKMIYVTLADEARYPARIVLGYNGYTTEAALRESFARFLEQASAKGRARGFGVRSLPSLVCCGGYSLVKANGMPYVAPLDESGVWPVYLSTAHNPMHLLLEVLWTRLVYLHIASNSIFGEDLELESLARCIDAEPAEGGWRYHFIAASEAELQEIRRKVPRWEPAEVDVEQADVLLLLGRRGEVGMDDPELLATLEGSAYTVRDLADSLRRLRLATEQRGRLTLLTDACRVVFLPDGRILAADDRAGHLSRWVAQLESPTPPVHSEDG